MILIADSGSTKTQWILIDKQSVLTEIYTPGINPFFQLQDDIAKMLDDQLSPKLKSDSINKIYFYGAGCAFEEKKTIVRNALKGHFNLAEIVVESDLLGAARGLFGYKKGIACILGTGSNSCFYDGLQIVQNVSPLGFILGDEGSGAVLSKQFISDCLKNQLPSDITSLFLDKYELTPAYILDNVYKKPFPNRFLAQFTPFLAENLSHPAIYKLVFDNFVRFFERNVQQYDYKQHETAFVGSVAYYFRTVLEQAATECEIKTAKIVKQPMDGLIDYHTHND